jgi:UDPglucose 6-dehydrogenase
MHSPEFLTEKTAAFDAKNPERNIIGITDIDNQELYKKAETVLSTLPKCPYSLVTKAQNAELIKYGGNNWFYFKVVFMNILYDLAQKSEADFDVVKEGMSFDSRIGKTHLDVVHQGGRGAGGHCFVKDFEAFIEMLKNYNLDDQIKTCEAVRNLNLDYLKKSNKNLDIIKETYGE